MRRSSGLRVALIPGFESGPSIRVSTIGWDLWIDFQRADDDGLTRSNVRNGLRLKVGDVIVVGNEDAEPGVGEVLETCDQGFVLVRVFPESVEENRFRFLEGRASAR